MVYNFGVFFSTQHNSLEIHPGYFMINSFFLWLRSIPFYGYISLFNHSPVEGCLDCFQFLTIINKAAINICVQVLV